MGSSSSGDAACRIYDERNVHTSGMGMVLLLPCTFFVEVDGEIQAVETRSKWAVEGRKAAGPVGADNIPLAVKVQMI